MTLVASLVFEDRRNHLPYGLMVADSQYSIGGSEIIFLPDKINPYNFGGTNVLVGSAGDVSHCNAAEIPWRKKLKGERNNTPHFLAKGLAAKIREINKTEKGLSADAEFLLLIEGKTYGVPFGFCISDKKDIPEVGDYFQAIGSGGKLAEDRYKSRELRLKEKNIPNLNLGYGLFLLLDALHFSIDHEESVGGFSQIYVLGKNKVFTFDYNQSVTASAITRLMSQGDPTIFRRGEGVEALEVLANDENGLNVFRDTVLSKPRAVQYLFFNHALQGLPRK
jgi:hypothetical protein